jgi:DNA-binding NtrC family response regulator
MQMGNAIKIFVVDSNMFSLLLLQQQLINLHYTDISVFDSSTHCMESISEMPMVVIIHYRIHPDNGIELLQKIKQFNPAIYVVFIASLNDVENALLSIKYGAFDYILKGESAINQLEKILENIKEKELFIPNKKYESLPNAFC